MTQPDPELKAVPPNVQVYESNPDDAAGASLDRRSGRRLPFILVGLLVLTVAIALGRRRRAGRS